MSSAAPLPIAPAQDFAERVVAWQATGGRHDLPWQGTANPYRVWVSEIMLQQTQVGAVIGYYARFMARFPELEALAAAPVDEVLHLWSGLGYYSRARNLHAAAQQVVEHHGGQLPSTLEALQALPGIGRSTAAAILSLALDEPHAILDGNVKRVLCRHRGVRDYPGAGPTLRQLWAVAEAQMPSRDAARYTQGMMDLGATLCTRSRPSCLLCPVSEDCVARLEGTVAQIPAPRPKRNRPTRHTRFLILRDPAGRVLLEQRPPAGVWGGLWGFPELDPTDDPDGWCRRRFGQGASQIRALAPVQHGFTHFELVIEPLLVELADAPATVTASDGMLWYEDWAPASVGMAAPVKRLLQALDVALGPQT